MNRTQAKQQLRHARAAWEANPNRSTWDRLVTADSNYNQTAGKAHQK